jgi:two-component system phosphate regulon sensor histidine kinase PhoR
MINKEKILRELNVLKWCKYYKYPLLQCPSFLFLVMGAVILIFSVVTYVAGSRYLADPRLISFIVTVCAAILFIIGVIITKSFEKLAEANRMKSEFVNIVSHQLKSPITSLKWTIELLTSKNADKEKQVRYFEILKENSKRMEELVSDLLMVSRIQQGSLPVKKEEICLEEITKNFIKQFQPLADKFSIEVKVDFEKDLPKVISDLSRIKLVIENLLDNALHYGFREQSVDEKREIKISVKKRNKMVYFVIKDNGIGIPQGEQKYIFQKFFRAANVSQKKKKGTGLGLYIAKSVIEKSGGKIGFKSKEGRGTTFWFGLPIV